MLMGRENPSKDYLRSGESTSITCGLIDRDSDTPTVWSAKVQITARFHYSLLWGDQWRTQRFFAKRDSHGQMRWLPEP